MNLSPEQETLVRELSAAKTTVEKSRVLRALGFSDDDADELAAEMTGELVRKDGVLVSATPPNPKS